MAIGKLGCLGTPLHDPVIDGSAKFGVRRDAQPYQTQVVKEASIRRLLLYAGTFSGTEVRPKPRTSANCEEIATRSLWGRYKRYRVKRCIVNWIQRIQ